MQIKGLFIFALLAAVIMLSGCAQPRQNHFIKAVYDGEPRLENGHIDNEKLIGLIKEHDANTYNYLIGHSENDWNDL